MENKDSKNLRVGFHTIEMLLKLSPENIKKIFIPANRNDNRVNNLIAKAEKLAVSIERKKSLVQHPEAILKSEISLGLSELKKYEDDPYEKRAFLYLDIISWLESKISNKPVQVIIKEKALLINRK